MNEGRDDWPFSGGIGMPLELILLVITITKMECIDWLTKNMIMVNIPM
jgi:hypothetical protein